MLQPITIAMEGVKARKTQRHQTMGKQVRSPFPLTRNRFKLNRVKIESFNLAKRPCWDMLFGWVKTDQNQSKIMIWNFNNRTLLLATTISYKVPKLGRKNPVIQLQLAGPFAPFSHSLWGQIQSLQASGGRRVGRRAKKTTEGREGAREMTKNEQACLTLSFRSALSFSLTDER